ncbi:MAG TPA: electron transport complex subunit RsxC [Gemmatimonadaceae bacterium]|nr:electron transport complex subunit RsxC [Gemmatimonadaceae bacterium]
MAEAGAGLLSRLARSAARRTNAFGFSHGVHPPEHKELTAHLPIRRMPFPEEVVLPLRQHAGKPAKLVVGKGAHVERGDMLAAADGWVSSPVHASASGWVTDIDWWPHPDGSMCTAVRLAVERYSGQVARPRMVPDWHGLSQAEVLRAVQEAGVVGLGGAAFPTHVKLAPPKDATIDTVVVNGAECEPYLTTDHRTMVEYPERVHFGLRIMMHALDVRRGIIGVERNKPDAIEALERTRPADLDVTVLPLTVKYPQGAEKMLIRSVLGREVASGKLPASVGVIVQNVGSVATLAEVFETGLPLVERIVTVSGRGVQRPANLLVPVGTKLRDLLAFCGGLTDDAALVLFGGPMMGLPQGNLDVPILKGTTGVVVLTHDEVRDQQSFACIHCGRCLDACPMFLNPSLLGELAKAGRHEEMEAAHLADCMLCGSCSYVCPSNIPLAQLFQASKTALRRQKAAGQ